MAYITMSCEIKMEKEPGESNREALDRIRDILDDCGLDYYVEDWDWDEEE